MGSVADLESATDVTDLDDAAVLSAGSGCSGAGSGAPAAVPVQRRQLSRGADGSSRSSKW